MASTGSFDGTSVPLDWFDDTAYPLGWFDRDLGDVAAGGGSTLTLSPTTAHVVMTGKTPSLSQTTTLTLSPTAGHQVVLGKTPTVTQSSSSTTTLSPTTGHQIVLGKTPSLVLDTVLNPGTGHRVVLGKTPTISQSSSTTTTLSPTTGHVVVAGKTPTLSQTTTLTLSPSTGHQVVGGRTPVLAQTANQIIVPSTGHVVVKGNMPTVEQVGAISITIDSLRMLADIWTRLGLNVSLPTVISSTELVAGPMQLTFTQAGNDIACTRQDAGYTTPSDANTMILEVYQRLGLDKNNSMVTGTSSITFAGIELALSGTNTLTTQRQGVS